jgi:hypothetical protein
MAGGSKAKYSDEQKRRAEHIEDSYERRGVPRKEAERRVVGIERRPAPGQFSAG